MVVTAGGAVAAGLSCRLVVERAGGFRLDVALDIAPGETVALLGPNGAGKSTAVSVLAGVVPLDEGAITLAGRPLDVPVDDVFVPPEHRRIGVVFQDYLLFPHLRVVDNVAYGLVCRGFDRARARAEARVWLERVDLASSADRRPSELSGGQAQRVALARALASAPDLLLLDEPLAALDVTTRAHLRRELGRHLAEFEGPRLLITHDPTDALLLADRIHVIEGGVEVQSGPPVELLRRPRTRYVADLAGLNLLRGVAVGGVVHLDGGHELRVADPTVAGDVIVTVHPRAVGLHGERPHGSARNVWETVVTGVEAAGDRVRVQLGGPVELVAEVTPAAVAELDVRPGCRTWVALKATEIDVEVV